MPFLHGNNDYYGMYSILCTSYRENFIFKWFVLPQTCTYYWARQIDIAGLLFYYTEKRKGSIIHCSCPKKKTLQLALHLQTAADIVVVGSNNVAEPAAPLLALLKRAPRSQGVARPLVPRRRWILISQKNSLMQAARSTKDRPAKRKRREMTRWRG